MTMTYFRESEREKHIVVKKSPLEDSSKGNRDKSGGAVKCPQCDMVFYKQSTMEIHLVIKIVIQHTYVKEVEG